MKQEILKSFFGRSIFQSLDERTPAALDGSENLWSEYGAFDSLLPTRGKEFVKNRGIGTKLALSCVALIGGLCMPVHAQQQSPAIVVRSNGEADVVVQGGSYFLQYYWATPGSKWNHANLGEEPFAAKPAIAVRSNGEADVAVQGFNNSLRYYWATPGSPWREYTIPGDGTMSSPAIAVRSTGEVDVVAVAYQTLFYYWAFPGSVWQVANLGSLETPQ
jgi:hypothetical protein